MMSACLTLSNASGAYLEDGTATGTINNTDAMPQAWIARFGRTVADQALDAVDARLRAARTAGMSVRLGGQRIGGAALKAEADEKSGAASGGTSAWLFGGTAAEDAEDTARLKALSDWLSQETAENDRSKGWSRTMTERELLMGSSFSLAAQTDGGGFAGLWGRMAQTRFAGREGSLSLDGEARRGRGCALGADDDGKCVGADIGRGQPGVGLGNGGPGCVSGSRARGRWRSATRCSARGRRWRLRRDGSQTTPTHFAIIRTSWTSHVSTASKRGRFSAPCGASRDIPTKPHTSSATATLRGDRASEPTAIAADLAVVSCAALTTVIVGAIARDVLVPVHRQ